MSDSSEFITTIKHLMRLTREGKINWEERPSEHSSGFPTLEGNYENLKFKIKEDSTAGTSVFDRTLGQTLDDLSPAQYILEIKDQSDNSQVTSPPMKAVRDLVQVIRRQPDEQKLSEINRRLGAS